MAVFTINKNNLPSVLLRVGLAVVFLYAAGASFISPNDWIGYLPQFARDFVSDKLLLTIFSVYELILVVWLLSGKYVKLAALLSAATLTGIVIFNYGILAITFRDIGLIFAAAALYFCKEK